MSEVRDNEALLRHVHPTMWLAWKPKPNSNAFRGDVDGLSVDREELRSVAKATSFRPDHGFARLVAGPTRDNGFTVDDDALPSASSPTGGALEGILEESLEVNRAHAVIKRADGTPMQKPEARILQSLCEPICRPGECGPGATV